MFVKTLPAVHAYVNSSIRCTPGTQLGGVHSILVSVDEQLAHAGISPALRHPTVGLLLGMYSTCHIYMHTVV